jgi:molecular chaperone IbpA
MNDACRPLEHEKRHSYLVDAGANRVRRNAHSPAKTADGAHSGYHSRFFLEDTMRHFDLSPLYRTTVGFDRLFNLLDQVNGGEAPSYPPYDIERTGDNAYRITMAVAGFADKDLSIEARENVLTVKGEKQADADGSERQVIYRGIAGRAFERRFQLADYVVVKGASLENGLLHIDLVREVPEQLKPRQVPIRAAQQKQIEQVAA